MSENLREGPGVMGSMEVLPSTPICLGYVKIHIFSQKNDIFLERNPKNFHFFRHFLNDQWS